MTLGLGIGLGITVGGSGGGGGVPAVQGNDFITSEVAISPFYALSTYPPDLRAANGKTWFGFQGWDWTGNAALMNKVRVYDPATKTLSATYDMLLCDSGTDNHGVPALEERPSTNAKYCFGGTHNGDLRWAVTSSPEDPSSFVRQADITGLGLTYPKPVFVGADLYLFARSSLVTGASPTNMMWGLMKSTGFTGDVPAFSGFSKLVDFGPDSRVYASNFVLVGTDIHFVLTFAPGDDSYRADVFYLIYDTTTGTMYNFDRSASVITASRPASLATMNASFRLVDQKTAGNLGQLPCLAIDAAGNRHIVYLDGPSAGAARDVKYLSIISNVLSSPVTIGSTQSSTSSVCLRVKDDGVTLDAWWTEPNAFTYPVAAGGDVYKATKPSGGAWSAKSKLRAATKFAPFSSITPIRGGTDDCAIAFGEVTGTSTSGIENGRAMRAYMYGDNGPVKDPDNFAAASVSYFAAMSAQEALPVKRELDALLKGLATIGAWSSIEALSIQCVNSQQAMLLDATGRHTFVNQGAMAGVLGVGFTPDGVNDWLDMGFTLATGGVLMSQNDLLLGGYRIDSFSESIPMIGTNTASAPQARVIPRQTTDLGEIRANDGTSHTVAVTDGSGFFAVGRSSAQKRLIIGTTRVIDQNVASTGVAGGNVCMFRGSTTFATGRAPIGFAAKYMADSRQFTMGLLFKRLLSELGVI
jgi:hypothetical protein